MCGGGGPSQFVWSLRLYTLRQTLFSCALKWWWGLHQKGPAVVWGALPWLTGFSGSSAVPDLEAHSVPASQGAGCDTVPPWACVRMLRFWQHSCPGDPRPAIPRPTPRARSTVMDSVSRLRRDVLNRYCAASNASCSIFLVILLTVFSPSFSIDTRFHSFLDRVSCPWVSALFTLIFFR